MTIKQWLADRRRKYADGLALFNALATDVVKKQFGTFLNEVNEAEQYDPHYSVLVNKLTIIGRNNTMPVQLGKTEVAVRAAMSAAKVVEEKLAEKTIKEILVKESVLFDLQDRITALEDDSEEHADELSSLSSQLGDAMYDLEELQAKYDAVRKGVKVVTYSSLPKAQRDMYDEIRQLVPLYASYFAEMGNEKLTEEERLPIAQEVERIDKRRSELWDDLDEWAESSGVKLAMEVAELKTDAPVSDVQKGIEMAKRIERLQENIRRTKASIEKHKDSGKLNLQRTAENRLAAYEKELKSLET